MKYLLSPSEYTLPNPRIDGFRKLQEVRARTIEISVFSLDAFKYYSEHKELPPEFVLELREKAQQIIESSLTHAAVVRRAFVIPGLKNPPGPHFLGLTTVAAVVESVIKLYEFALTQNYHISAQSQISGFLYAFVDPEKYNKQAPNILAIPYGGYAISSNDQVEIYAVFGNNEGVQSLVADRYEVGLRRQGKFLIHKKEIPQKSQMHCTTETSGSELVPVPVELQFDQVLVDNEILEVARVVSELTEKYGPQRVEFSADASGLIFNEVADYWKEIQVEEPQNINVHGLVKVINSLEDLNKLSVVDRDDLLSGKIIVRVGENIIARRDYDVLGALAAWDDNLYVLYPGVAATQHAMRILTDKGHRAFLIGNQKFDEGDEAQIVVAGSKVRVTNLSRTENQQYVSLWDASLVGLDLCGGKADRLSKLKILGFQVPHGAVLTTRLYDEIMAKLGLAASISLEQFEDTYHQLENPPTELINLVSSLLPDYISSGKSYSVRSSATIEDNSRDSMAGLFETYLNISKDELPRKALAVIRSAFAPQIVQHIQTTNPNLTEKLKMAVVLQEMVQARCAGVIFGAKAQTANLDIVEIEANQGLGEGIVSGEAKQVESYKFSRSERRIAERKGPELLTQSEAKALFMLSERLRQEFNDIPQDIEWAIDQAGQIWVLQSRDLYIGRP
jgi:pyruvate,water dikinase